MTEFLHNFIINRWESIGLTKGLESPQKEECASCFEKMACYLICKSNPDTCDNDFETVVFPIIRRAIQKAGSFNGKFSPEFVEKFYYDNLEEAKIFVKEKAKIEPDLDREANMCDYISNKLAENLKRMEENKLYDLQDEPLLLNRFVCEITLDGVKIDSRVVRGFKEERYSDTLYVNIALYEKMDYEWLIDKAFSEKGRGELVFKALSPSLETIKIVKYKLSYVSDISYPEYKYNSDNVALIRVAFKYEDKKIEYVRGKDKSITSVTVEIDNRCKDMTEYEKRIVSENDKAFLKASKELLEDAKRRVENKYSKYENSEETMNSVLGMIEKAEKENDAFAEQAGCCETDLKTAKYKKPSELWVERYNKRKEEHDKRNNDTKERIKEYRDSLKRMFGENMCDEIGKENKYTKKHETSFDFGDFNTALEWYKHHIVSSRPGRQYYEIDKFGDIDRDIDDSPYPTIAVCSRRCGITTHMIAWSLARISTAMDTEIWFVTPSCDEINKIFNDVFLLNKDISDLRFLSISCKDKLVKNADTNSKIMFMSIAQNSHSKLISEEIPDYVVYDDMAFFDYKKINEFIDVLDGKAFFQKKYPKEICVSTPSRCGSVFNFLATISGNKICVPWNEGAMKYMKDNDYPEMMKAIEGEENFEVEMNCKIGSDNACQGYKKSKKEKRFTKKCCGDCSVKKEKLPDDYGYTFLETYFPEKQKECVENEYEIEI